MGVIVGDINDISFDESDFARKKSMQVVWYETNIAASHGDVDGMASIDETKS